MTDQATTFCAHRWRTATDAAQIAVVHMCCEQPLHAALPHRCTCGEIVEYRHDDDDDDAVQAAP